VTRTDELRALHRGPPLLVLPNAWDVASARVFAALPGCRAVATSSAAVARSLGWEDGEQTPVAEMLRVVERIAAAVDVPVTGTSTVCAMRPAASTITSPGARSPSS